MMLSQVFNPIFRQSEDGGNLMKSADSRYAQALILGVLMASLACTRTGSQAAEQTMGRGGSKAPDSDRDLPGYLVDADNGVDFVYFAPASGITASTFPVVLHAHVLSEVDSPADATVVSEPILLSPAESDAELSEDLADRVFMEVCTRTTQGAADMGVIFPEEMLYFQALVSDGTQVCFSRMARFVFNKPYAFIRTANGAAPSGYTLSDPPADPLTPEAAWAESGGAGSVTFGIADGQDSYAHAISVIRDLPAVPTCAGGYSFLGAAGIESINFSGQDPSATLAARVCAIDPVSGFGSPGAEFALEPRAGAASSSGSTTSSSSSGAPAGSHVLFVTSTPFAAMLGPPSAIDARCMNAAAGASLSGVWKAVISITAESDAKGRISITAPVYNMAGERLADDADTFWDGQLEAAVGFDEFGAAKSVVVWTGSATNGGLFALAGTCSSWSVGAAESTGRTGFSGSANTGWISMSQSGCDGNFSLYCISQ